HPDIPATREQHIAAIAHPAERGARWILHVVIVLAVHEGGAQPVAYVAAGSAGKVHDVPVRVAPHEYAPPARRAQVRPAWRLGQLPAFAAADIYSMHIPQAIAGQVSVQLLCALVRADGPASTGCHLYVSQALVGQPDQSVLARMPGHQPGKA